MAEKNCGEVAAVAPKRDEFMDQKEMVKGPELCGALSAATGLQHHPCKTNFPRAPCPYPQVRWLDPLASTPTIFSGEVVEALGFLGLQMRCE